MSMLYCPKCRRSYSDGNQRFCDIEGARLLPVADPESAAKPSDSDIFTRILKKTLSKKEESPSKKEESLSSKSGSSVHRSASAFSPPSRSKYFSNESVGRNDDHDRKLSEVQREIDVAEQTETFVPLPIAKIIDPRSIPEINSVLRAPESKVKNGKGDVSPPAKQSFEAGTADSAESNKVLDFGVKDTISTEEDFELNPNDPLDTFELFDSKFEVPTSEIPGKHENIVLPVIEEINGGEVFSVTAPQNRELNFEASSKDTSKDSSKDISKDSSAAISPNIDLEMAKLFDVPISPLDLGVEEVPQARPEALIKEQVALRDAGKRLAAVSEFLVIKPVEETDGKIKATDDDAWERRSSDAVDIRETRWFVYPLAGFIILALGFAISLYLTRGSNLSSEATQNPENPLAVQSNSSKESSSDADKNFTQTAEDPDGLQNENGSKTQDAPPPPRSIEQPPNTKFFENDKKNYAGVLAEKFLGFSIYYPKDWKQTESDNKFLDIAKKAPDGLPIKQLLISRYESNGTFEADRSLFYELASISNADLREILANYQIISEEEASFQGGRWKSYEVKFQGVGSDKGIIIWGRRLWIPTQRPGVKSGFIITMIGTSLAEDVKSAEDLGVNDDLAEILRTFEPDLR